MKMLLEHGLLHGDCVTISGQTGGGNIKGYAVYTAQGSGRHPAVGQSHVCPGPSRHTQRQSFH